MYWVDIKSDRPDFRVFIDLLYSADHPVDTDGDAETADSRDWNTLYIADRQKKEPVLRIYKQDDLPHTLIVQSESERQEELAALYLFLYCGKNIRCTCTNNVDVVMLQQRYHIELERASKAKWHQSV